jgi:hypothetical protein
MSPARLRDLAQQHTNNSAAIVIGVVRRPDWNNAPTFPEYICLASLNQGTNSMTIRVVRRTIENELLDSWPGGGTTFISLEEIDKYGYLFRWFAGMNREQLKNHPTVMRREGRLPRQLGSSREQSVVRR